MHVSADALNDASANAADAFDLANGESVCEQHFNRRVPLIPRLPAQ